MRVLRKGMRGLDVGKWQYFLRGLNMYYGVVDDDFGNKTHESTVKFQKKYKLGADGVVGRKTYTKAFSLGFGDFNDEDTGIHSVNYPPEPTHIKPLRGAEKEQLFGKIEFVPAPTSTNKEKIKITNNFEKENIVMVKIPQLDKATNGKYTRMRLHKKVVYQTLKMFEEFEKEGLLDRILSYAGAYYPRFIRGSETHLSNHSWGTAIDLNVEWNKLGATPALVGQKGSLRELVPIMNKWGYYWGGHFNSRKDGHHIEVAKIIPKP